MTTKHVHQNWLNLKTVLQVMAKICHVCAAVNDSKVQVKGFKEHVFKNGQIKDERKQKPDA